MKYGYVSRAPFFRIHELAQLAERFDTLMNKLGNGCEGTPHRNAISSRGMVFLVFWFITASSIVGWMCPCLALANEVLHPLAPPDRSSPRATMKTFLDEMNQAVGAYKAGNRDDARALVTRAVGCLNLSAQPPAISHIVGIYTALYLKETLDRIELPPSDKIPDAKDVETQKVTGWTIPYTEITVAASKDGPAGGVFLFTPDTVKRSQEFYNKVRNLPYNPGAQGALYEELTTSAGPMIPKQLMDRLPQWSKREIYSQALWQWTGLVLFIIIGSLGTIFSHRYGYKALGILDTRFSSNLRYALGGLILPIMVIAFAQTGVWFGVYGLHFRAEDTYRVMAFTFLSISYLGRIWLIGAVFNRAAGAVSSLCRFEPNGMRAELTRFGFNILTGLIVIGMCINLGARLGLPTYSLVTGLGVGGLAVALAGREALSNLIGTIAILLDQPFKLGDFIVLGDADRGTVTAIGLRSTRIRTRDGILVSIPNASVANMKILNESAPVYTSRIHVPVGAAYGSSVEEVEQALLAACQMCEYVVSEPAPTVRLVRFGDSALQFELLVWIVQPEFRNRTINQLNRAICEEFRKRGIEMPFPQRDVHIRATT